MGFAAGLLAGFGGVEAGFGREPPSKWLKRGNFIFIVSYLIKTWLFSINKL